LYLYDGYDNGVYTTKEYAVESTWLSSDDAKSVPQLDTTTTTTTNNRVVMAGTFNTEEARKIYNKLAVRNVLAGRVPLFKYDNTFKASFSEPTYQVTSIVTADNIPADFDLPDEFNEGSLNPTSEQPFVILNSNDATYTAQLIDGTTYYTKTSTPKDFANNVITEVENNAITEIATNCEIKAGADGVVSDVTLADGELIKFRAPNFTTKKTYPAYVNYHLALNKKLISEARNAEATTLFELLDADRSTWTPEKKVGWQKLLEYFDKDESRKQ
jgi:hypothetical protein